MCFLEETTDALKRYEHFLKSSYAIGGRSVDHPEHSRHSDKSTTLELLRGGIP